MTQKILFWEWVVKEEFAFSRCDMFLARIDHLHLKSSIPVKICRLKGSGEAAEKALEMNFEIFLGGILPFLI